MWSCIHCVIVTAVTPSSRLPTAVTARGTYSVGCAAVSLAAWVGSVSALRLSYPPQTWNLGAGPPMGQGPCAVGRDGASVDAAAVVDGALGVFASVMMPTVSDTKASSVEALAAANVECVTVTPTARAERASAVRTRTAVSVLREGSAVGTDTANATAASAWTATTVPYVISAQAARHHARDTGTVQSVGPLGLVLWPPIAAWLVPMPT